MKSNDVVESTKEQLESKFKSLEVELSQLRLFLLQEVTDNERATIEAGTFIRAAESCILNAKTRMGIYD